MNQFACLHGHTVMAFDVNGQPLDLAAHICPVCVGMCEDADQTAFEARLLSPKQPSGLERGLNP